VQSAVAAAHIAAPYSPAAVGPAPASSAAA
jgi:hypothetical protein